MKLLLAVGLLLMSGCLGVTMPLSCGECVRLCSPFAVTACSPAGRDSAHLACACDVTRRAEVKP